jgi:selenide,water dikinase
MNETLSVRLTQYSHGAGCGCKISPSVLDQILKTNIAVPDNDKLIVGNHSRDDAAVLDLGDGKAMISTTDFFMPIVDNPYDFGRIAAANAISDVYAMGGTPVLAIAILGWPINKLSPDIAQQVIEGGRSICTEAGIPLAGGHSIDSPEPIFGLSVNGLVQLKHLKQNNTAQAGNILYLTKSLGVGILTTAEKKGLLKDEHENLASRQMMELNKVGQALGRLEAVKALTDVTGFGLLGHLVEMAEGSDLSAVLQFEKVPLICDELGDYIDEKSIPGGTMRNWESYGHKITGTDKFRQAVLADPQTSGGLLIALDASGVLQLEAIFKEFGLQKHITPIGQFVRKESFVVSVQ